MHDFENVLSLQLDSGNSIRQRRRTATTPASKEAAAGKAAAGDSQAEQQPTRAPVDHDTEHARASPVPCTEKVAKAAGQAPDGAAIAAIAAVASPAPDVAATPAACHQAPPQQQLSPALPASCSAVTPAVLMAGLEQTPASTGLFR